MSFAKRIAFIFLVLIANLGAALWSEAQGGAALHWSEKRSEDACAVWYLYAGHERVAHVLQCDATDADYVSVMQGSVYGVFDDLELAKKRCEEVYKHRDQEAPAPKEEPASLEAD